MRVDADRVRALPACEQRPELGAHRGRPRVRGVDVEPDPLRGTPLGERGDRVDRRRRGRADGRDERAGVGEVDELRAHRERVVPGHGPELELEQAGSLRRGRMGVLGAHDDALAGRGGAGRGERRHEPGRRGVLEMAVQPRREAEQVGEPGEGDLLELLERRRRPPEDPDLVEPRREELGEHPGRRPGAGEVREVAGALPVRQPRHEHLVEVPQHGGERLPGLGRPFGERGLDRAGLDRRQHRLPLVDPFEVRREPLERGRAVVAEAGHRRAAAISRQGRVLRI